MEVVRSISALPRGLPFPAATIGNFDGVHLGHQLLVERLRAAAEPGGGTSVVVTFDPHPVKVLRPDRAPAAITTLEEKLRLLRQLRVGCAWVIPFDEAFSQMPAEHFVEELLVGALGVRHVVLGPDCRFGRGRRGDVALLQAGSDRGGFAVERVEPLVLEGAPVSSSRIRALVSEEGDVAAAARLLGRPFRSRGVVVQGAGRGRTIGFPTANLLPETELCPARGVYAALARLCIPEHPAASQPLRCVVNIGRKPTFGDGPVSIEAHLPGFEGTIYGSPLELDFVGRIRDERRFESVDALVSAIRADIEQARGMFG